MSSDFSPNPALNNLIADIWRDLASKPIERSRELLSQLRQDVANQAFALGVSEDVLFPELVKYAAFQRDACPVFNRDHSAELEAADAVLATACCLFEIKRASRAPDFLEGETIGDWPTRRRASRLSVQRILMRTGLSR